ncbi:MAG: hypothetical protein A2X12_01020 [Bacteroidetes bacterium GWE2_29_8]|nr:MAG: hypothetical protein A2X12_01020 [Bacteroidetes bacterium GWE2_29_8]OFY15134.1 MAG: hypothetical protein A2X02_06560 [Bacteroidetes bacterium GWF2_29_10]
MLLIYFISALFLAISTYLFKNKHITNYTFVAFLIINCLFNVHTFLNINKTELLYFTFDSIGILMQSVLSILGISTFYFSKVYLEEEKSERRKRIYYTALTILIVAMNGVYLANDATVLWILIEATTLSVAMLIYHERTSLALEATWKYVFICSTGIALAYMGILFLSALLQTSNHELDLSFLNLTKSLINANPVFLKIAFIFIFIGYSTKMGLFPMHTVTIDAHTIAPPPISALISTALMNVGFIGIFRIYNVLSATPIAYWMNNILIISGILSILTSTAYLFKVNHVKRMLAYSSLENMGIVAIGLGIGGIGYYAAILHIVLHSFAKAGLFYNVLTIHKLYDSYDMNNIKNYISKNKSHAYLFILLIIMLSAIPPSGLFISKIFILQSLIIKAQYMYFIIIVTLLCFLLYNLLSKTLKIALPDKTSTDSKVILDMGFIIQLVFIAIIIYLGIIRPPILDNLINQAIIYLPI